jgi:hypothetical protein
MIAPNQITAPIIGENSFGKSQITIIPGIAPVDFERSLGGDLVLRDFDDEAALLQDPTGSDAGQFDVQRQLHDLQLVAGLLKIEVRDLFVKLDDLSFPGS